MHDRTNAHNPQALAKFERYRKRGPDEQGAILGMPAVKQWVIHAPVEPTLSPGTLSWSTPGGQSIVVDTLLPASQRRLVYNESELWPETSVRAGERKWQVRVVASPEQAWDTFLNVVQAFDSGTERANTLVRSTSGDADGVLVRRGGHPDTLAVFNAIPGPRLKESKRGALSAYDPGIDEILRRVRLRSVGYTLQWNASTPQTDVLLFDLNPELGWKVTIGGGDALALAVSPRGVARVAVPGAGAKVLKVEPAR